MLQTPWIKLTRNGSQQVRIFCFPYSGGTAQVFLPLAGAISNNVEVYALELPGRGRRFSEPILHEISAMVAEAKTGLESLAEGKKVIFYGHSLGGIVAFELARTMKIPPSHLFVSGVRAPRVPRREDYTYNLEQDEFIKKVRAMGGTPEEILKNQEMLEIVLPILRSDFKAYENYQYKQGDLLGCPVTAFGGTLDTFVTEDDIKQWTLDTSGVFSWHMFDGGHFIMHTHLDDILKIMDRSLRYQHI